MTLSSLEVTANTSRKPDYFSTYDVIKRLCVIRLDSKQKPDFIVSGSTRDLRIIVPEVKKQFPNKFWWLNDYWQKKSKPNEMCLGTNLKVYDFLGSIGQPELAKIKRVEEFFSKVFIEHNIKSPSYLIFDDVQEKNFNSGNAMNGKLIRNWDAIQLYPNALISGSYRATERNFFPKETDHFLAVLIHEYSHFLEPLYRDQWKTLAGWKELDEPIELSKGVFQFNSCTKPQECISDYALFHTQEDYCESVVGYLLAPTVLQDISATKYEFMKKLFNGTSIDSNTMVTEDLSKQSKKSFPQLPDTITVQVKPPKLKWK